MITKTERVELRSMVRQQFKVLRAEVQQRKAELIAECEVQIGERYRGHDEAWDTFQKEIRDIVHKANEQAHAALEKANIPVRTGRQDSNMLIGAVQAELDRADRYNERKIAEANIEAMVKGALLKLDRDEADLIRTLTVGALESAEAKQFLSIIPTVGELVSMARLLELEKAAEA